MPVEIDMFNWLYSYASHGHTWIHYVVLQDKSGQRQVYSGCNMYALIMITGL